MAAEAVARATTEGENGVRRVIPVSVVIPAFNRAALLRRAVASVRRQSVRPAQIIVCDDASSDDTAAVAEELGTTLVRHTRNRGAAAARNTALRAATCEWFAPLDSDDEWLPGHLETLWAMRDGHVLVAGSALQVGGSRPFMQGVPDGTPSRPLRPRSLVVPYNTIPASAVLARADVAREIGGYDERLRYAEDWDLWLRILERGSGVQSSRIVCLYHVHDGQKSSAAQGPREAKSRILCACRGRGAITAAEARMWRGAVAWNRLGPGIRRGQALAVARAALRLMVDPVAMAGALRLVRLRAALRRSVPAAQASVAAALEGTGASRA